MQAVQVRKAPQSLAMCGDTCGDPGEAHFHLLLCTGLGGTQRIKAAIQNPGWVSGGTGTTAKQPPVS